MHLLVIHRQTFAGHGRLGHLTHGAGGLLAAHHRRLGAGPAEQKTRRIATAAHTVVARAKTGAALDGDLRHGGIGHGLNHLAAVLDHSGLLTVLAHHIARGVLQIDDGVTQLAHPLNEVRRLVGTGDINGAVVRDQAHGMAVDMRLRTQRGRAIAGLEWQQCRPVHQSRHDFTHIHRLAMVGWHQAE